LIKGTFGGIGDEGVYPHEIGKLITLPLLVESPEIRENHETWWDRNRIGDMDSREDTGEVFLSGLAFDTIVPVSFTGQDLACSGPKLASFEA
jgi:hypothetical protein